MINVKEHMDRLAAELDERVSRPVTADPTKTANTPCVLIELPRVESTGTLCGEYMLTHTVMVIGQPGAHAELAPLSRLLAEVLDAFDTIQSFGVTLSEPVTYFPLVQPDTTDPCMSYKLTVEEF